jgi:hypothetical protein
MICPVYSRLWKDTERPRRELLRNYAYSPDGHKVNRDRPKFVRIDAWQEVEPSPNSQKMCPQCGRPKRACWSGVNCQLVLGQNRATRGFSW